MWYNCKKCGNRVDGELSIRISVFKNRPAKYYMKYRCERCGHKAEKERAE